MKNVKINWATLCALVFVTFLLFSCDINKRMYINGYRANVKNNKSETVHYFVKSQKHTSNQEDLRILEASESDIVNDRNEAQDASELVLNEERNIQTEEERIEASIYSSTEDFIPNQYNTTISRSNAMDNSAKQYPSSRIVFPIPMKQKKVLDEESKEEPPKVYGLSIVGLVLAVLGFIAISFFAFITLLFEAQFVFLIAMVLGILLAISGLVLSIVSLIKMIKSKGSLRGKGLAIAGLVLSGIALFISSILTIVGVAIFS